MPMGSHPADLRRVYLPRVARCMDPPASLLIDEPPRPSQPPMSSQTSPVLAELLAWMRASGAQVRGLEIRYLGRDEGHAVFASQPLRSGDVTIRVPFKLTMSVESAAASELKPVLEAYRDLPPDEVLALHLMHERGKGAGSFFAPFLRSLPRAFDLPVFWSDEQLQELAGTNVLLLTQMMKRQLAKDFDGIHTALMDEFPGVFPPSSANYARPTLADYEWAMGVIWSRAFGVTRDQRYLHVLCPTMDMFNHDVQLRNPLDDFVRYNAEEQTLEHRVCTDDGGVVAPGSPVMISYGQYSNAKLLYSYGFAVPSNPRQALDLWMKIPPSDPYAKLKQTLLDSSELTREQTYDFRGTLFPNDVDERLLATLRVILMDEQEIRHYKNAFEQSIVSVRNELAVYENLQVTCARKLSNYPTTIEDDRVILKSAQLQRDSRQASAVQVRLEDKLVLSGVIATLDSWKQALAANPTTYPPLSTRQSKREQTSIAIAEC